MHRTVISISAKHLERVLRELLRRGATGSQQGDVERIVASLQPYTSFKRTGSATRDELDNWTHHAAGGGGLIQSLSTTFQNLVNWSSDINIVRPGAPYTNRLLLATWKVLGARNTVRCIINEVVKCRIQGTAQRYAEDVAASMILSTEPQPPITATADIDVGGGFGSSTRGGKMGLLEALRSEEAEESLNLAAEESVRAEALRSVLRKVEMQLTPFTPVHHQHAGGGGAPQETGVGGGGQDVVVVDLDIAMDDGMEGLLGDGDLMGAGLLGDVTGIHLG